MKEEEAKAKAQERIDKRAAIFCPLIKAMCRTDCECFEMPEVYNTIDMRNVDHYDVQHGLCTASCLTGQT